MKRLLFVVLSILFATGCDNNNATLPGTKDNQYHQTKINASGDYVHKEAHVVFPENFMGFKRGEIDSYTDENNYISVDYRYGDSTSFTVYICPGKMINNNSFWAQYYIIRQPKIDVWKSDNFVEEYVLPVEKDGYRINGVYDRMNKEDESSVSVAFPCGKWYLRLSITSINKNGNYFNTLRDSILAIFNPIDIMKTSPVKMSYEVSVDTVSISDANYEKASLSQASSTINWALNNVDSQELCSGLPVTYLEYHTKPIMDMVAAYDKLMAEQSNTAQENEYITSLKKIIDDGYLNECVMEKYYKVLIPKDGSEIELHYDEYDKWKKENIPGFELSHNNFDIQCKVEDIYKL